MSEVIGVLVVDDNEMMRRGLCEAINLADGMEAVGAAESAMEALQLFRELKPDVVTMDYQMPGENGLKCTERILAEDPEAKVVLISVFDLEEDVWNAVQCGVVGYLTKKAGNAEILIDAIREVAAGEEFFPAVIAKKLNRRKEAKDLTDRELKVLELLARGCSNKEIMDEMNLTLTMVKYHIVQTREKLGALDRTQAVVKAFERGILKVQD
ncbi:response regulator [Coraliomargarita akajimensis]|uniref:Two component transcriptional regulator, LuxR family n=1 Tax=Coraliomargarita akajimensis (strain DSM 45221 / IAM 15411 / JCM 23193 / KCTC 12865 / 04OKA010-24) TaxID=583355 RepID=D5ER21_CORAD|nr:response regulator transcription factor [Coraliomargarita akajimensis]ADE54014.1 two component transcriptional regulator, LuxR family [Coraliomargarita akajimensis DSM 45221]